MMKKTVQQREIAAIKVEPKSVQPKSIYADGGGKTKPSPIAIDPTWLYFTMPDGGTVTLTKNGSPTAVTLEYSLDNGGTWTEWTENGGVRTLTLTAGQTMHVRNTSSSVTRFCTFHSNYYTFGFNADTYSGGDITSLLCVNPDDAYYMDQYIFANLMNGASHLRSMPLIKNVNTSQPRIFYNAFRGTGITETTLLEQEVLTNQFYQGAFHSCSNLKIVKTKMTDISASNPLSNWLSGVAPTGDFYCPASLTIPTGSNGIPSGWTRHDI